MQTGYSVFDTILPITHGQRLGIFSGSGVGKSSLLAGLSERVGADATVIGLIGERGREVGELARRILGGPAAERTVIIAATSDQSALARRRAAYLTLAVAEHFRDEGRQVLCLLDSLTRFAEAHREIALAAGELPALRGFPPSTLPAVAGLCERAGPGVAESVMGDITALFTVLVAGGDMDEPIADLVRGILDGHVILDREIAERGRFPSIDVRRSVSRSAPGAWSEAEQAIAVDARRLIAAYEDVRPMIQSGLYIAGADPVVDRAVKTWPALDEFVGSLTVPGVADEGFRRLAAILSSASEQ